jgi:uncharacterized LabA/DUF88 family protein
LAHGPEGTFEVLADTRLKIAVFIDFDNIEIGVKSTLGGQFDIGIVLEALKERGDVVSKIAYGDWTRAGDYSRSLTQHATKLVQRNLTPGGDKNGADINLALDALEMAFTHSHINAYVIVGGDSDFITLVEKLKQYDKQIFVVGGRSFTSMVMQRNCHEFIAYENLVSGRRGSSDRGRQATPSAQAPIDQVVPLVRRALKVLVDREVTPQLGLLKSTLLQLDSTFSERTYGVNSFRDFAQKLASAGHVTLREAGRNVLVELKEEGAHGHHRRREPVHEPVEGAEAPQAQEMPSAQEAPPAREPRPSDSGRPEPVEGRAADGIREIRRLFQTAQNPPRWPMYVRQAKQFLRNVDANFDERKFGFGNITDLFRACQREGLFRVERDRQGVIRLFPGNVMQPIGVAGVTRATDEDDDNRGNVADPAAPLDDVSEEAAGEPDVVEGDVVREIETPQVVDGVEAAAPSEAQPPARGGRGRGRAKAPGLPRSTEGRKPRKSPAEGAAPRVKRAAAKPRAPRARPKVESPP